MFATVVPLTRENRKPYPLSARGRRAVKQAANAPLAGVVGRCDPEALRSQLHHDSAILKSRTASLTVNRSDGDEVALRAGPGTHIVRCAEDKLAIAPPDSRRARDSLYGSVWLARAFT